MRKLLSFWLLPVCGGTRFLEHTKYLSWHFHTLFNAIKHHRNGVQVVLKLTLGTILGMRNSIASV